MFELYRHKKTGGLYVVISQDATDEATAKSGEESERVVYASVDTGRVWVRSKEVFFDGRFERVESATLKPPSNTCIARRPLRYGSRVCGNTRNPKHNSDCCDECAAKLWPHQIINGTLYIDSGLDEEGEVESNPYIKKAKNRSKSDRHRCQNDTCELIEATRK